MPFADALDLFNHFVEYPPAFVLLRAQVGYKPPGDADATEATVEDLRQLRGA